MTPASLLVALGLGSNRAPADRTPFDLEPPHDPRARALEGAMVLLRREGHELRAASPLYETAPEGGPEHGPFLNACVLVASRLPPAELLAQCEEIERQAGRSTKGDRAPRPLDIDLLAAWTEDGETRTPLAPLATPRLVLPHPRLHARAFALVPLVAVAADAPIALPGEAPRTAWELLRRLAKSATAGVKPGPRTASFPMRPESWEIDD